MGIPRTVLGNIFSLGLVCDLFAFTVHYFYRAHDHLRNLEVSLLPDQVFSSRQRQDSPQLLSGRHVSLTWTHPLVHLQCWAQTRSCLHGDTPHRHTHCAHITWVYTSGHQYILAFRLMSAHIVLITLRDPQVFVAILLPLIATVRGSQHTEMPQPCITLVLRAYANKSK